MLRKLLPVIVFVLLLILSFGFGRKGEELRFVRPEGWPGVRYDVTGNAVSMEGFRLGRRLFYDRMLSGDGKVSCGSCHSAERGFAAPDDTKRGKRNTYALSNLAWNTSFMWDGGVNNLEVQPLAPITSADEMATTLQAVINKLKTAEGYKAAFFKTYGDSVVTGQRVLKALTQYMLMLESYNSKYDRYVRKEFGGGMSKQELSGLKLFRANCASCHSEPLFTNYSFQNIGLAVNSTQLDNGRMRITRNADDSLKFKVPSLRNVAMSAPYMHDGRFRSLNEVLNHYSDGIVQSATLAKELSKPMKLSAGEKEAIIAFLETLTDTVFLNDVRYRESGD